MDRIFRIEQKGRQEYVLGHDDDTGWSRLVGDPFGDYTTGAAVENEGVRLLAPVQPSKIVAVGLNYRDHAREMNKPLPDEPLIFLKPSTTVIGPNDPIVMPPQAERVDYEAELGIVIRKRAKGGRGSRGRAVHSRTDVCERRDGAGSPDPRRAIHTRKGIRYIRADRTVYRGRSRWQRFGCRVVGQW